MESEQRVFSDITKVDLGEIRDHAIREFDRFLTRAGSPRGKFGGYRNRLLFMCLAQGAAQHFVDCNPRIRVDQQIELTPEFVRSKGYKVSADGKVVTGVKDIDVFMFFAADPNCPIPVRKHCRKSTVINLRRFGTRRFDFMKKGIQVQPMRSKERQNAARVLRRYLESTAHGRDHLAKESVIGLHPKQYFGDILWAVRRLTAAAPDGGRAVLS
jgi:hypothetical protein